MLMAVEELSQNQCMAFLFVFQSISTSGVSKSNASNGKQFI